MMNRTKYPRTYHFHFSPGKTSDDKVLGGIDQFIGHEVVITEKLDGENTTLYPDGYIHARSVDSQHHPSRTWVKNWWNERCWKLQNDYRICGENLYAQHSIKYDNLETYFFGFSVFHNTKGLDICLNWDDTLAIFKELNICCVPVLYRGIFDANVILNLNKTIELNGSEGYVMRTTQGFSYPEFPNRVAKYVRANHVTTNEHWMNKEVVPNKLRKTE